MKIKSLFYSCFIVLALSSNVVLANDFEDDFMIVEEEFAEDDFSAAGDEDFIPDGEVQNPGGGIANPERKVAFVGTRELFNKLKIDTSIKINEDLLMNYYLFKNSNKSVFEDVCKYNYIVRYNSASRTKFNENKRYYIRGLCKL